MIAMQITHLIAVFLVQSQSDTARPSVNFANRDEIFRKNVVVLDEGLLLYSSSVAILTAVRYIFIIRLEKVESEVNHDRALANRSDMFSSCGYLPSSSSLCLIMTAIFTLSAQ